MCLLQLATADLCALRVVMNICTRCLIITLIDLVVHLITGTHHKSCSGQNEYHQQRLDYSDFLRFYHWKIMPLRSWLCKSIRAERCTQFPSAFHCAIGGVMSLLKIPHPPSAGLTRRTSLLAVLVGRVTPAHGDIVL
jgi:hypothetical protein